MAMQAPQSNIDIITEKIDILKLFEYLGVTDYKTRKEDYYIRCLNPNHKDTNPSLSINHGRYKGFFNCWSCEFSGKTFAQLISRVKGTSEEESLKILAKIAGVGDSFTENEVLDNILKNRRRLRAVVSKKQSLPEIIEIDLPRACISALDHPAAEWYNIPREFIEKFDVKFCERGYYQNRLIFPIYFEKKLVSFLARWYGNEKRDDKAIYPENAPTGRIIFNYDNTNVSDVVLVEGIKDCIRVLDAGYECIASLGNKITEEQVELITKKYKKLIVLPDRNSKKIVENNPETDPGMLLVKKCISFLSHKVDVFVGFVPDSKDPGDSTVDEIKRAVKNSRKYTDFDLQKKEELHIVNRVLKPIKK